jgi:hypothetical protein
VTSKLGVPLGQLAADGSVIRRASDGSRRAGGAFPVRDAGGQMVGALLVRHRLEQ